MPIGWLCWRGKRVAKKGVIDSQGLSSLSGQALQLDDGAWLGPNSSSAFPIVACVSVSILIIEVFKSDGQLFSTFILPRWEGVNKRPTAHFSSTTCNANLKCHILLLCAIMWYSMCVCVCVWVTAVERDQESLEHLSIICHCGLSSLTRPTARGSMYWRPKLYFQTCHRLDMIIQPVPAIGHSSCFVYRLLNFFFWNFNTVWAKHLRYTESYIKRVGFTCGPRIPKFSKSFFSSPRGSVYAIDSWHWRHIAKLQCICIIVL